MQIVRESEKRTVALDERVRVYEYDMDDPDLCGATARITGRYPARGYVVNRKCKELVYVLEGRGRLIRPDGETAFAKGDAILVDIDEKYALDGEMTLFMATSPTFDPAQHEEVES